MDEINWSEYKLYGEHDSVDILHIYPCQEYHEVKDLQEAVDWVKAHNPVCPKKD